MFSQQASERALVGSNLMIDTFLSDRMNSNYSDLFRFMVAQCESIRSIGEVDLGDQLEHLLRSNFVDPDQVVDLTFMDDEDDGYVTPPPLVRSRTLRCPPAPSKPRSGFERRNI
jgi:hypothetical protein